MMSWDQSAGQGANCFGNEEGNVQRMLKIYSLQSCVHLLNIYGIVGIHKHINSIENQSSGPHAKLLRIFFFSEKINQNCFHLVFAFFVFIFTSYILIHYLLPWQVAKCCFVPALLGHAIDDDFIRPHHSDRIFEAYMVSLSIRIPIHNLDSVLRFTEFLPVLLG